jgi:hypothetical protein
MTERPKGRPDINVPEVGNDADNEPVNICGRVSVDIAKGRLDGCERDLPDDNDDPFFLAIGRGG